MGTLPDGAAAGRGSRMAPPQNSSSDTHPWSRPGTVRAALPAFLAAVLSQVLAGQSPPERRHLLVGPGANAFLGVSVSEAGDVDQDGWPDLVVGASGVSSFRGLVRVHSGRTGAVLGEVLGGQPFDELGYSVSAAGDANLDGYADVACGAIGESLSAGMACGSCRVLSGEWMTKTSLGQPPLTPQVLWIHSGDAAGDNLGILVSDCGDVNLDGVTDLVVGAPRNDGNGTNSGSIQVLSGASGQTLATFLGDAPGDQLGHACSGAGDVDQDGWPDVAGGAFSHDAGGANAGMVRVYSGEWIARTAGGLVPVTLPVLATHLGDSAGDRFGLWVGAVGDVNADGYPELLAGAPSDDYGGTDSGSVTVLSGEWMARTAAGQAPVTTRILWRRDGEAPGDGLGLGCAAAGDVNGDGIPDVAAGANLNDVGGPNAGMVRLCSGTDGSTIRTFYGSVAGAQFGLHVSTAGDVNRDGFPDVIVGAPFDDANGTDSGSAFVLSAAAGESYGLGAGAQNTLSLEWVHSAVIGGTPSQGEVRMHGAAAGAAGLLAISFAPALIPAGPITVLVDLGALFIGAVPVLFDASGSLVLPVDLRNPGLAGQGVYLQAAEVSPGLAASGGLLLLFTL